MSTWSLHKEMPKIFRRKDCRLCGSSSLDLVLSLTPTPAANAYVRNAHPQEVFPLELFLCRDCSHAQLLDVVDPEILFSQYLYVSGTSPAFVRHFEDYANDIFARAHLTTGSWVVDIGSNDGTLLGMFQKRGCKVLGIDPARNLAEDANRKGIATLPLFFNSILAGRLRKEHGAATLITANNVFAHADNLREIVTGVKDLLAPEGLFVFEVSYLADVYTKALFDTIYHEHLSYHTISPLVRFFQDNDMELIDAVRVDSHGGSVRGIAQHRGGSRTVAASIDRLIAEERALGLDRAETFINFGKRIDETREQLVSLLKQLKKAGKTIAGYGAPAKATTLMYHFALSRDVIDYIVDDNPLKQGWLTPGLHIPIVPAATIYERRPDYLLILAWNFADSIMKNHSRYAADGGRFIVPLPHLSISKSQ